MKKKQLKAVALNGVAQAHCVWAGLILLLSIRFFPFSLSLSHLFSALALILCSFLHLFISGAAR
jgi:hypothetical protein